MNNFLLRRRTFLTRSSATLALGPIASSAVAANSPAAQVGVEAGPSADDFQSQIGTRFIAKTEDGKRILMRLMEVNLSRFEPGRFGRRQPFSLIFRVLGTERLPQDVYRVVHPSMGAMDQLLVPVYSRSGHCVESVFG